MAVDADLIAPQTILDGAWSRWGKKWHFVTSERLACESRAKKYDKPADETAETLTESESAPDLCVLCLQRVIGHTALVYTRRSASSLINECSCGWSHEAPGKGAAVRSSLRAAHEAHVLRQIQPSDHSSRQLAADEGDLRAQFLQQLVSGASVIMRLGGHQIEGRVLRTLSGDRPIVVAYEHRQRHGIQGLERTITCTMSFDMDGQCVTPRSTWILDPVTWNSLGAFAHDMQLS